MTDDPHGPAERRVAARHLLGHPLTCREHDPETFRLIRRHEAELDRWFTQRLGYRLHLSADTARLFKTGAVPDHRPLTTASGRPLHHLEYVFLLLALGATSSGPSVISLRDLIEAIRSAAAEIGVALPGEAPSRRALVAALRWMIDHGLASELHANIDSYAADETADAVLAMRPDRIALLALPAIAGRTPEEVLGRAERREATRQWLRVRLCEDPVLYRDELTAGEWGELRRRIGDEQRFLDEMFGLALEARAEGVASVDPQGGLTDRAFPTGGTEGHAALLLIAALRSSVSEWRDEREVVDLVTGLAGRHARHWSKDLVANPERLTRRVVGLLVHVRLAEERHDPAALRLLPAALRYAPEIDQGSLL